MVGSAAGQRERIISEGMTVPVKGIAMFESRDGGTAEVVGLLSPPTVKNPDIPFWDCVSLLSELPMNSVVS